MRALGIIGRTLAQTLGRDVLLTLHDGAQLSVRAVFDPRHVETEVGDYGAQVQDIYPVLDIPREALAAADVTPDQLYGAMFDVDGKSYTLETPHDDEISLVRARAYTPET